MFQSIFNVVLWSASALSQLSLYNTEFIVFFTSKLIFSPNEKPLAKKQHNTNTHGSCFVRGAGYRKESTLLTATKDFNKGLERSLKSVLFGLK